MTTFTRTYGDVRVTLAGDAAPAVHGASERDAPAYAELFLHDLFLLRNLSEPASFETPALDPRLFATTRQRVPFDDVVAWYDSLAIGTRQIATSAVEIALFELLTLSRRPEDELESITRLTRAATALGLEVRTLPPLPTFHPMHDDALDPSVEDATAVWVEATDEAARAIVEALQERIRRHSRS